MSSSFTPRSTILDISAYVPGKSSAGSGPSGSGGNVMKLSSNETPLGPSRLAMEAYQEAGAKLQLYPDGGAAALRAAIGEVYGLNLDHLICGAGSDEILSLIAYAYLSPGDEAIYTEHGFLVYRIAILAAGGVPVIAKEVELTTNVDEILKKVTEKTRLVFIANPNNPTGTYLPMDEVKRLREQLPDRVGLVLDGAYAEYVHTHDYEAGIELVATTDNVIMTRTFSKIFGLASLRVGWAFSHPSVIDVLNRIRGPFNLSGPAIVAASKAIGDQAHKERSIAHNDQWLEFLSDGLRQLGYVVTPSVANFILVHFDAEGPCSALAADEFLLNRGIIVRRMEAYGLPKALRITIGTEAEIKAVIEALSAFKKGAKS